MQAWRQKSGSPTTSLALCRTRNMARGLLITAAIPLKNRINETMLTFTRNKAKQAETLKCEINC
jgi:hypothetical protein